MDDTFNELDNISKKLNIILRKAQDNKNDGSEINVSNLRVLLSDYKHKLDSIDNDIPYIDEDLQKSAKQKLKINQSDYDMKKTQVNKIEEQIVRSQNIAKFSSGQLKGQEAKTVERDMIVDLHKETDEHGEIINEIGKDIIETNQNLKEAGIAVNEQGEQIKRIHVEVNDASGTVKKTDKRINEMNRRNYCLKIMMHLLVLLLFILDIGFLVYKLMKKAG